MPDIKALQLDLDESIAKGLALQTREKNGARLTDDEERELTNLHDRVMKLQVLIEGEKKASIASDFSRISKWMEDPDYKISRSVNADDEGKSVVARAGWETKNGKIFIPTSSGKMVEMYDEEVLFGPIPQNDQDAQDFYKKTRVIVQPEYRVAYTTFLRNCGRNRSESMAFHALDARQQKALSEGQDSAGGYLVPPDLHAEVLVRLAQVAVMRRLARMVTTSRDRVIFPRVLPNSDSSLESIYSSGFVGGWVGETPAFSETDPQFGQFEISIKKLRIATKVSNDFISDAITDIPAWLAMNGAENMALVEDAGFITGVGGPLQPQGFLNDPGLKTVDVEGSTTNTISNTAAANGSANKLINMAYALPSQYAAKAEWLMKRSIEGKVRQLVDGAGRYLWPAMTDSGFIGRLPPLMGANVNNSEFMPADGTDGNKVLAYGDFSQYIIAQRAQMSTVVLRERFADTDQTGIIIFERVGGALWNNDAIRVGIV